MMKKYKAIETDKMSDRKVIIEDENYTKADFIHDLRRNGYAVNPIKVKNSELFDWIMKHTDCNPWDWKLTSIPNS